MRALLFAVALVCTATAVAGAQPAPNRREIVKKKIRAMRAYTLTEELQLDPATAGKLFPLLAGYDDELDKLVAQRVDARKQLNGAAKLQDARAINKAIDDALAVERSVHAAEDRRVADFRKILTPQQVARILVVLPDFDRKIQNQLARAIRRQGNAAPGGGGGGGPKGRKLAPPGGEADDDDDIEDDTPVPAPPRASLDISCKCQPPARIIVDGVDTGLRTPQRIPVQPGKHKVTYVVGNDRYTYVVDAVSDQVTPVQKDLR